MAGLATETLNNFKATLRGPMLQAGDDGYDTARSIWNAMIDRRPALIVRAAGVADVMASVNFARKHELLLAVRGGGHNIAGNAVCDGGLMLDLSLMKSVQIAPTARRAYVEAGATLRDFDHEAQAFGLATPIGVNSTTGVAGLTLGGGFGWLSRLYGLSVDNLVAAEIVTADGQLVRADADSHPDLFWAIRGGGGNFGVVTMFEFALHPVGPQVLAGLIVFPHAQAQQVLTQYHAFVERMPDQLNVWAVLRQAPPLPFLPPEVHGQNVVVLALFYPGNVDEGMRLIAPLRGFGQP
ncbi:MAG TPA: FAD-binding oxidoreductase, partial [Polaromonas sp.]